MSALDTLTRRIFELHKGSVDSIAGLQGFNNNISTLNRAISRISTTVINAVNAIAKAMSMFGQMQGLFITGFARDLMPTLPPILDTWNTEIEEAVASGLEPLKLSIFWRLNPPTDAITRAIHGLVEGPRKISIPAYEGIPTIPSMPLVTPPPTQELMKTINDYIGRTSEIEYKFYEAAPAIALRVGINYGGVRRRATRGVFDVARRGVKEAFGAETLIAAPPRLEAVGAIREVSDRFMAPASVLASTFARVPRYVLGVSEAGRVAQPIAKGISATYNARVLEAVSKVHEVSGFTRRFSIPTKVEVGPALEMAKASGLVLSIPDMERGLQPITRGGVEAYRTGPPGIRPPTEVVAERAAEAPLEVIVKCTDHIKSIGLRSHDIARSVAGMRAIRPPPMETRLFSTFLDVSKRKLDGVSQEVFDVYHAGTPAVWTPSIREAAKIVSDHIIRISGMALKEAEAYGLGLSRAPSIMKAMEAATRVPSISESVKVPSLGTPVAEKTVESKQVLVFPEVERLSQLVAEKIAETYRHGVLRAYSVTEGMKALTSEMAAGKSVVSRVPSVTEAMEAALRAPSIKSTGRVPSLGIPLLGRAVQSKPILVVTKAKSSQSVAQRVAKTYTSRILNYIPKPIKAMADRVTKVSGFGGRKRAPDHGLDLVGVKQKELSVQAPSVVHPPSPSEIGRVDNVPVTTVPETDQVFHASGVILKELIAKTSHLGIVEAQWPYVAVEAMEAVRSLSGAVPRVSGQFSRMVGEKHLEIARAFAVEPYSAAGSGLKIGPEMNHSINLMRGGVRELSMAALSIARPSPTQKIVNVIKDHVIAMPEISRALAASNTLSKEFTDHKMKMEKTFKIYLGRMLVSLPRVGKDNLERIPLEAPVNVPSVKLQEIIPILSSIQTPAKRETPRAKQRNRPVAQPRPITVNVEPLKGESDLRELRRKIVQILREEARRHGVF